MRASQVTVLIGATGSGKSTQTLPFLADAGFVKGRIACTQPRKVAATSLAQYVASEWGGRVGDEVGVNVGGQRRVSPRTRMVYTTERTLLNELVRDPTLAQYGAVVVDEAHERSIDCDILLGLLKSLCAARPEFKVVVASATIDPAVFQRYFGIDDSGVIRIPGRTFPVEHEWEPRPANITKRVVPCAVDKTMQVLQLPSPDDGVAIGDVLVFLPTPADCTAAAKLLETKARAARLTNLIVLPLHGQCSAEDQARVFQRTPHGQRKVVFATNVAETSVTIDGVTAVIDTGLAKSAVFDAARNMNTLVTGPINRSSVVQRAGRAGRTQSGVAYVNDWPLSVVAAYLDSQLPYGCYCCCRCCCC